MKIKKLALVVATLMAITSSIFLGGCFTSEAEGEKVMNLSLNPQVEFLLDANDKVVSVNALNEEGNLIVSAAAFKGKTAEEAAKLFVKVSKETGFIVSGEVNNSENQLKIAFSGDAEEAEALYNSVKTKVDEYLTEENITATIEKAVAITEAQLKEMLKECAPYIETAKIEAMNQAELMKELTKSRKETAKLYSQELKTAYYEAKALAMEKAELIAIKTEEGISGITAIAFDTAFGIYETAMETLESTRNSLLVAENSPYQLALKAFRDAKINYLNYRNYVASLEQNDITTQISEQLATFQETVDSAENTLLEAGVSANEGINEIKAQVENAYNSVVSCINDFSSKLTEHANAIITEQKQAQTDFINDFETNYASIITEAKNNWDAMRSELTQGQNA